MPSSLAACLSKGIEQQAQEAEEVLRLSLGLRLPRVCLPQTPFLTPR